MLNSLSDSRVKGEPVLMQWVKLKRPKGRCAKECSALFILVPSSVEINPRFYRGKEKSFRMRLSEGKQILERKRLNEKEI